MTTLGEAEVVLAIQPHYDDNDIACGGTLALLADRGAEIHYLTVTDDLAGVLDIDMTDEDALAGLRADAVRAARSIGVTTHQWLGHPDAAGFDHHVVRNELIAAIRAIRPDTVVTCDPWLIDEGHVDHIRTGLAAVEAAMLAGLPRLCRETPDPAHEVNLLALAYTLQPNTIIDTSSVQERRHQALDAYQMQFDADGLAELHLVLDAHERSLAPSGATHGEGLFVAPAGVFHCGQVRRGGAKSTVNIG